MTRARKNRIVVAIDWNSILNKPEIPDNVTYETLQANGDVGTGADQLAVGNHDHDVGDLLSFFQNKLI